MNNTTTNNDNTSIIEADPEYTNKAKAYIEEKYSQTFDIVSTIYPESGFNTAMQQNIITLKDSGGIRCNIRADLSDPYNYYDDYFESYAASLIEKDAGFDLFENGKARVYVAVNEKNIKEPDISAANVRSLTLVAGIDHAPSDEDVQKLYDMYRNFEEKGYTDIFFIVGFTEDSAEFDLAVGNYRVYGKSNWSDYKGKFYAYLTVKDTGLSFDDFKASVVKQ